MAKLNPQTRATLQSARAKNRKLAVALGEAGLNGVKIPTSVIVNVQATAKWLDKVLAPKATKATKAPKVDANTDGGAAATDEAENSGADLQWTERLQELVAA